MLLPPSENLGKGKVFYPTEESKFNQMRKIREKEM